MPYNPELHANLGYVDKRYKTALQKIRKLEHHGRDSKAELEYLIAKEAKAEGIKIDKIK